MHNKQLRGFYKHMPNIILKINAETDKIYDHTDICCYLAAASLPETLLRRLAASEKLLLLSGAAAADRVKELDAGGLVAEVDPQKPVKAQIRPLREKIGLKKALGAVIEPTRHQAMLASETEPEFVAFRITRENASAAAEVIRWYNELFLIQSALDLSSGLIEGKLPETDFVIINSRDYDDFSC